MDIEPNGDVLFCASTRPIGNVREQHPREIWQSALAKQRRTEIRSCSLNCRIKSCNFRKPLWRAVLDQLHLR